MTLITVDTKLMPLLPLMLRPDAKRGLVIAFGMGTAFRMALKAGARTDAVELVPSVPGMFHWYYPDATAVLANPAGKVIIADGRNHVELTSDTYDFVVVDPPPPIESSGVSVISSLEFYRAAKARLNPQGVMVQWVPYGQTLDEFLAHVRTFLAVFPNVRVIAGAGGYGFYMVGSDGPVDLTDDDRGGPPPSRRAGRPQQRARLPPPDGGRVGVPPPGAHLGLRATSAPRGGRRVRSSRTTGRSPSTSSCAGSRTPTRRCCRCRGCAIS